MLTIEKIKDVVTAVGKKYGIKNAYLFGSYAKNMATETSDVDLIIDRGEVQTYNDYFHMCEELEERLQASVDITAEEGMFPGFFDLVKNDRILLYAA